MKVHPEYHYEKPVPTESQRAKDFLDEVDRGVKQDIADRQGFISSKEHYFRRRYCLEWRDPPKPWVGSSNIVLPLIDKKIDELKPQYVNLVAAAKPPVTVHAVDVPSQKKVKSVELFLDWLIKVGSPNFIEEIIYAVDDALEMGRGVIATGWRYETRKVPDLLQRDRLPQRLRQLVVAADEREADFMFAQFGGQAKVLSKREFDGAEEAVRKIVSQELDLDPEEPMDQKALDEVIAWFRAGAKEPLPFQKRDVILNVPCINAVSQLDLIVPAYTTDLERTERITEVMYVSERELLAKAEDHKLGKAAVKELLDRRKNPRGSEGGRGSQLEYSRSHQYMRDGVMTSDAELIELWKTHCWVEPRPGALAQKAILLRAADHPDLPLKFCLYDRPGGRWPYHTFGFEHNKKRWYAPRGVPEKLDDIDAEITEQHRAKINRMRITLAPTFKVRPNRGINWSAWRFEPGTALPCPSPDDAVPFEFQMVDPLFDAEVAQLRVWADEAVGGTDYGLTNPLSSADDSRTATEIQAIQGKARQSLSLRGLVFQRCMAGVYQDIFDLWHRYGDAQVYIRVTGGAEPIVLTKEELQGKFVFQCTGTIGDNDPVLEAQKALARIQILAQLKAEGALEPKYSIDLGEAVMDWLEKDDLRVSKRVIHERSPEEIQAAIQAQKQAMQQAQQHEMRMALVKGGSSSGGSSRPPQQSQRKPAQAAPARN